MIAALYVQTDGCYAKLDGVDPRDEVRDARNYLGPHPVVAHPPCARWCRMAGLVEKRWGHPRHVDGGTFKAALADVRRWGGVLEHPAYSDAWAAFGLPRPPRAGGWVQGPCDGWSCHVEQVHYGHRARKATWLYVHGHKRALPDLIWGPGQPTAWVGYASMDKYPAVERLGKKARSATPPAFRDILLSLARGCA